MSRFFIRFFPILLALFLAAAILLARTGAHAAEQIGVVCESLGVSTMAQDQKNLIVCLKDDAGALVWKSMTSGRGGSAMPIGGIMAWPVAVNPDDMQNEDGTFNWLDCNGQGVPASLYPELYKKIGARVPDLQGRFLRGRGGNSASLGVAQADAIKAQSYGIQAGVSQDIPPFGNILAYTHGNLVRTTTLALPGEVETRPINMAVRYLIRARP